MTTRYFDNKTGGAVSAYPLNSIAIPRFIRRLLRSLLVLVAFAGLRTTGFTQQLPTFNHVFVVLEENTNYANVIGNNSEPAMWRTTRQAPGRDIPNA